MITNTGYKFRASFVGPEMRAHHNGQLIGVASGVVLLSDAFVKDNLDRVQEINIREDGSTMDITVHWAFEKNKRIKPFGAKEILKGKERDDFLEGVGLSHHTNLEFGKTSEERIIATLKKLKCDVVPQDE